MVFALDVFSMHSTSQYCIQQLYMHVHWIYIANTNVLPLLGCRVCVNDSYIDSTTPCIVLQILMSVLQVCITVTTLVPIILMVAISALVMMAMF